MVTWGSAIRSRGRGACPLTPLNWNPHSLLQINPNPTPLPSTQLTLVYNTYVYPPRVEERDSKMDGFKLGVFYSEARINRSTGELLLYDWSNTKSRLDPDSFAFEKKITFKNVLSYTYPHSSSTQKIWWFLKVIFRFKWVCSTYLKVSVK